MQHASFSFYLKLHSWQEWQHLQSPGWVVGEGIKTQTDWKFKIWRSWCVYSWIFILGCWIAFQPVQPSLTWQSNKHAQQDTLCEKNVWDHRGVNIQIGNYPARFYCFVPKICVHCTKRKYEFGIKNQNKFILYKKKIICTEAWCDEKRTGRSFNYLNSTNWKLRLSEWRLPLSTFSPKGFDSGRVF